MLEPYPIPPEDDPMEDAIHFLLSNFTLTFLVVGLIASGLALLRAPRPLTKAVVVEALFAYFLLFSIGVSLSYNFVFKTFFGDLAAGHIGWDNSPFQTELAFASLGFAVVGFLAFRGSFDLRLAAVVGSAMFLLGAAGVHVYEMVTAHNFAPGNAGVIFWTDILIPVAGFALLWLQRRSEQEGAAGAVAIPRRPAGLRPAIPGQG
jgi:type IV secretory pathway VirB2 component (pilin)